MSDKTLISILVDHSGSMYDIATDTEGGIKSFLADQAKLPGKVKVRLAEFDNRYKVVYEATKLKDVPDYKLNPAGATALVDAIGKTLVETAQIADKFDNVIVVILTDGYENSSREWTTESVKDLITEKQEAGWQVIFLGANIDAVKVGGEYGIGSGSTLTYGANTRGVNSTFAAASSYTTAARSGLVAEFTDDERTQALGE